MPVAHKTLTCPLPRRSPHLFLRRCRLSKSSFQLFFFLFILLAKMLAKAFISLAALLGAVSAVPIVQRQDAAPFPSSATIKVTIQAAGKDAPQSDESLPPVIMRDVAMLASDGTIRYENRNPLDPAIPMVPVPPSIFMASIVAGDAANGDVLVTLSSELYGPCSVGGDDMVLQCGEGSSGSPMLFRVKHQDDDSWEVLSGFASFSASIPQEYGTKSVDVSIKPGMTNQVKLYLESM
ncbi:hypothetical protein BKA62DRAFT_723595 [Auriculariales sp. MPI-PUGE-AT-0066]|nr:hypothetical protein BKA62DRAFT_723595 [Auriculariales sp. MPI-PUGE-AT-0066]